jgi:nitrogen regulatory protein PII
MKCVRATIDARALDLMAERLRRIGAAGLTFEGVHEFGPGSGLSVGYRGNVFTVDFVPKVAFEIVVADALLCDVIDAIVASARTDSDACGDISVETVETVIRIRTGERDDAAL